MLKGSHFDQCWYLAYGLSLCDLKEMMAERGIGVDHSTIHRWVVRTDVCSFGQTHCLLPNFPPATAGSGRGVTTKYGFGQRRKPTAAPGATSSL